jgi:phosphate transport system permease protein
MSGPSGPSPASTERKVPGPRPSGVRPAAPLANWGDGLFRVLCQAAACLVIVLFAMLVAVVLWKSWLAIETIGIKFFTSQTWDPEPSHRLFGALAFVFGTIATSVIAMIIAVPLGVGTAAFLSEVAPRWLRRPASFLVEMLAAIPSVVYGFWGLFVLAPWLQKFILALGGPNNGGLGMLTAGLILSIMIVPYVAAVSFDACQAVPRAQREGSLALGATQWQTIWSVVLPFARPGIFGGCFIALGRALGETMAVTMLIGNRPEISFSPFAMGDSIASAIANQFTEATYDLYLSALVELGLVLLVVNMVVNALARLLIWRVGRVARATIRKADVLSQSQNGRVPSGTQASISPNALANAAASSPPTNNQPSPPVTFERPASSQKNQITSRLMTGVLGLCLVAMVVPLFLILGNLIYKGVDALNWNFFVELPKPVGEEGGGIANAIYGSGLLVGMATLLAVPIAVLAAIFLAEYRSDRLGPAVRFVGELLGGVPSIVIGLFTYVLLVKPLGHFSGYAGAFALAVMMIPVVMRASEEALKVVPTSIRHASYALGAQHWQTILRVVIPAALPAIITGVFLGIARVGGETAPLLLTASSNQYYPTSPNDWTPSLPVYVYNYAISPYKDWHDQAWAAALVLLAAVMILNFGIRFFGKWQRTASQVE